MAIYLKTSADRRKSMLCSIRQVTTSAAKKIQVTTSAIIMAKKREYKKEYRYSVLQQSNNLK